MRIYDCFNTNCPEWSLDAIINGNYEGLTEEEKSLVTNWMESIQREYPEKLVEYSLGPNEIPETQEAFFCHHPDFGPAGMCYCISVYILEEK